MQGEDIADLVNSTLNNLGEGKMEDLVTTLQDHIFYSQLMDSKKITLESGPEVQFNVQVKKSSNAKWVGIGEQDSSEMTNVLATGKMPWKHFTSNWSYDEREIAMNPSSRRILNLIKTRESADTVDVAEEMENWAWKEPDANETKEPGNIRYWVVPHITGTSATTGGFNGTVPSGYTTVADLNPTTYPTWANWTKKYSQITADDLVDALDMAFYKTNFKSPIKIIPSAAKRDQYEMFSTKAVCKGLDKLARAQNDNIGKDVLAYRGQVLVNRVPVIPVPQLDANDSDGSEGAVFGINWGVFMISFLKGQYWKRTGPIRSGTQHTMWTVHNDLSMATQCINRRKLFVVSKT